MMRTLIPALLLLGVACAGSRNEPEPATPAAQTAPEASPMPAAAFPPLPGWLGFAALPNEARSWPLTPSHPNAKLVIFDPKGWDDLSEGTVFRAATTQGNLEVKYSEESEIPYGCEDTPTLMVAFQGPYDFQDEAVWILPEGMADAKAFAPQAGASTKDTRAWTVGEYGVALARTGDRAGTLTLSRGGAEVLAQSFEKWEMEGAENEPLDLTNDNEIGMPVPLAAFSIKPNMPPILVTRTYSWEGVHFEVFTVDGGKGVSVGKSYAYMCAF